MKLPQSIYALVIIGALVQVLAVYLLIRSFRHLSHDVKNKLFGLAKNIFFLSFIAFVIKIVLQMFSTIPSLNQYTYGFRPIVIGYLHLVLLGVISLFILAYSSSNYILNYNKWMARGVNIFVLGILINELLLMLQGATAMQLLTIPYNNELLLGAAFILLFGSFVLFRSQNKISIPSI